MKDYLKEVKLVQEIAILAFVLAGDLAAVFPAAAVGLAAPGRDTVVGFAVLDAVVPYQIKNGAS